jgi:hypothetical protein
VRVPARDRAACGVPAEAAENGALKRVGSAGPSRKFHQHIVSDYGAAAIFRAADFIAAKIIREYQP